MILLVAIFCLLCADFSTSFQVIKKLDHDNSCFTQGLLYHGQYLYESCGLNRESVVKKIDHTTGKVIAERILSDDIFAEGNLMLSSLVLSYFIMISS